MYRIEITEITEKGDKIWSEKGMCSIEAKDEKKKIIYTQERNEPINMRKIVTAFNR